MKVGSSVEELGLKYEKQIQENTFDAIWILSKDGKYGIAAVDSHKYIETIIPFEYDSIEDAEKDMGYKHYLLKKDGKVGLYYDESSTECVYDDIKNITDSNLRHFDLTLYLVSKDGKFGLLREDSGFTTSHSEILPCEFDSFDIRYMMHPSVSFGTTPYIFAKRDGKISVYAKTRNGFEKAFDDEYEDFKIEDDDGRKVIYFKKDGKWGVMGVDGKEMAPFEYDEISRMEDGRLLLRQGKKYAIHSGTLGDRPTEAVYDKVYDKTIDVFGNNYVLCKKDDKFFLVDTYKKEEYPAKEFIENAYNEELDRIKEDAHNEIKEAKTENEIQKVKNNTVKSINNVKAEVKNIVLEVEELTNEKADSKDLNGSKENALKEIDNQVEKDKNDLMLDKDED